MRAILALTAMALPLVASAPAHAEITYPWCAQYSGGGQGGGGRNCGFWTHEQCEAARSGNGGYCIANPMYAGPQPGMVPPPPGAVLRARR